MAKKNETVILGLTLLITTGVVGVGLWWLLNQFDLGKRLSGSSSAPATGPLELRLSQGEDILVKAVTTPDKEAGVQAFVAKDFSTAVSRFQASLQQNSNDPEALIYQNNARVLLEQRPSWKIAVSVPIGSNLNVAQEILRGVAQAQNDLNQRVALNGDGKLLEVMIANDDNNADIAKAIATEFIKNQSILAVVGHNASNASLAAAPVYQQGRLVMISPTSFANNITEVGDYIFRTVPSIRFVADTLSRYVVEKARKKNIAICFDSKAPDNQSFRDEFVSALFSDGGKFIRTACDFSAPDFNPSTVISEAVSSGADGFLLTPHVDRIERAMEVARTNEGRLTLFGSPTLYTYKTLESGQNAVSGMVLAVPWHPNAVQGSTFPAQAKRRWGGTVNWRTAMAYDAVQVATAGLKQNESRDGLQSVLSNPKFSVNGATGTVEFLPSGDRNGAAVLVQVQPGKTSGAGYDFVSLPQ